MELGKWLESTPEQKQDGKEWEMMLVWHRANGMKKIEYRIAAKGKVRWKPIKLGNDLSPLSPVEIPLSNYIFCMGKLHDPTFPRLVEYTDQKQTFTNRFRRQVVTFADSVNRKRRLWKAVTFADVESFMAKP